MSSTAATQSPSQPVGHRAMKARLGGQRGAVGASAEGVGAGLLTGRPRPLTRAAQACVASPQPLQDKVSFGCHEQAGPFQGEDEGQLPGQEALHCGAVQKALGAGPPGTGPLPGPPGAGSPARPGLGDTVPATCSLLRSSISVSAFRPSWGTANSRLWPPPGPPGQTQNSPRQASRRLPTDPAMTRGR